MDVMPTVSSEPVAAIEAKPEVSAADMELPWLLLILWICAVSRAEQGYNYDPPANRLIINPFGQPDGSESQNQDEFDSSRGYPGRGEDSGSSFNNENPNLSGYNGGESEQTQLRPEYGPPNRNVEFAPSRSQNSYQGAEQAYSEFRPSPIDVSASGDSYVAAAESGYASRGELASGPKPVYGPPSRDGPFGPQQAAESGASNGFLAGPAQFQPSSGPQGESEKEFRPASSGPPGPAYGPPPASNAFGSPSTSYPSQQGPFEPSSQFAEVKQPGNAYLPPQETASPNNQPRDSVRFPPNNRDRFQPTSSGFNRGGGSGGFSSSYGAPLNQVEGASPYNGQGSSSPTQRRPASLYGAPSSTPSKGGQFAGSSSSPSGFGSSGSKRPQALYDAPYRGSGSNNYQSQAASFDGAESQQPAFAAQNGGYQGSPVPGTAFGSPSAPSPQYGPPSASASNANPFTSQQDFENDVSFTGAQNSPYPSASNSPYQPDSGYLPPPQDVASESSPSPVYGAPTRASPSRSRGQSPSSFNRSPAKFNPGSRRGQQRLGNGNGAIIERGGSFSASTVSQSRFGAGKPGRSYLPPSA